MRVPASWRCWLGVRWEDPDHVVLDVRGDGEAVPVVQRMFDPLREVLTEAGRPG